MNDWLAGAIERVERDPGAIGVLFPAAGRKVGREHADEARSRLLTAVRLTGAELAEEARVVYRYGDNDEKRAVLLALDRLDVGPECVDLLRDALRSNDTRLVQAALGPYARHLPDADWRHAVLKSVFMGLPLSEVDSLDSRADAELGRMLGALRTEREAAGRVLAADAIALLERLA
jgi:L-ribulose-5-phosphate 3-epimerase